MPDPTDRDRQLARLARTAIEHWKDLSEALEKLSAQARQEGREEGIREALGGVPTTWLDPMLTGKRAVFDRNQRPEQNVQNVLQEVRLRLTALLDQPPEGEKTP